MSGELVPERRDPRALSPDQIAKLGRDHERAAEHARNAEAAATKSGYAGDWKRFASYCEARGVNPLPAHPELVASYLTHLADFAENKKRGRVGYRPATLERAKASIAAEHRRAGLQSPCSDDRVKRTLKSIKRTHKAAQRRAWPIMPEHLRLIFKWIDGRGKPVRGLRDKALLLAGWCGGLRRSELVALQATDVRLHASHVVFFVERSKTDQAAKGAYVDFSKDERLEAAGLCPLRWLGEWAPLLLGKGPFLRFVKGEELQDRGLSVKKVERLVLAGVRAIGLDPKKYSAHSLRSGVATYLIYVDGQNPFEVKKHLRHKSIAMLDVYVRDWDEVGR